MSKLDRHFACYHKMIDQIDDPSKNGDLYLEAYKNQIAIDTNVLEGMRQSQQAMFDSVMTSGSAAIRSVFILNGGACIALLTFLGRAIEHEEFNAKIFDALIGFAWGGVLAGGAAGFLYISQFCYQKGLEKKYSIWVKNNIGNAGKEPGLEAKPKKSWWSPTRYISWMNAGYSFHLCTLLSWIASGYFFVSQIMHIKNVFVVVG